jgi:hypothetical protein
MGSELCAARIALLALAVSGCAISQEAFGRIARTVADGNAVRYQAAEAGLRERGYVFHDDDVLFASLDEDTRRRCLDHDPSLEAETASRATVVVAPASRSDRPPPVPTALHVTAHDACRLFRRELTELDVVRDDGTQARILRIDRGLRLARDSSGRDVLVAVSSRVVSQRSVLVDRSCDHMPSPPLDPLVEELQPRVLFGDALPPRIEMIVEEEALDVQCTHNTY